jgi:hypothetical protein
MKTARRFDGVWSGGGNLPNNFIQHDPSGKPYIPLGGCCQYSGLCGLYAGWRDAMIRDRGELRINYFMNRQSPGADMTTAMPIAGRADITLREPLDVRIRVPNWLKTAQIAVRLDGKTLKVAEHLDAARHWVALGRLAAGAKIEVEFPLEERETEETFPGQVLKVRWRGNYVVQVRPRDGEWPIFP